MGGAGDLLATAAALAVLFVLPAVLRPTLGRFIAVCVSCAAAVAAYTLTLRGLKRSRPETSEFSQTPPTAARKPGRKLCWPALVAAALGAYFGTLFLDSRMGGYSELVVTPLAGGIYILLDRALEPKP